VLLNQAWPLTQTFTYDSLNRVATAQSLGTHSSAPGTCWAETYNYDAWGNLYSFGPNSTTQSAYIGCSQESGLSSSATTQNQLSTYTYDAAGNLIIIPGVANYTYDAENHLVSAGGLNYSYDGDGKRVMKSNGTLYWYGAGSDPLFESDTSGYQIFKHFYFNGMRVARQEGWSHGFWMDHYVYDALGNARFVYGYNGAWDVSDYYPFGGERPYQSQEGNVFKFTGKERDAESGLDNFGARYDSSSLGRFMSPDWSASPEPVPYGDLGNPQSLNLYSYVKNNPLNLTDPDGHCWVIFKWSEHVCNFVDYGVWKNDKQLQAMIDDHREWLKENFVSGGGYEAADVGTLNSREVWTLYNSVWFAAENGNITAPDERYANAGAFVVSASFDKLQHIYDRHASDFGLSGPKNREQLAALDQKLKTEVANPSTQHIQGTYRGQQATIHVTQFQNAIVTDASGNVVAGFKLSVQQLSHVISSGQLN
jgi:RHS repeat-associated protein